MIKLIGTDFDGTLLNDDKEVPKENIEYFKKAKRKGIKIVGITGRTLESVKQAIGDISIFDYLILNNGSNIYDVKNNKIIYENSIPLKIVKEITNFINDKTHQFSYCTFSSYFIYKNFHDQKLSFIKEIKNPEEIDLPISKINIYLEDQSTIYDDYKKMCNYFPSTRVIIMQDSDSEKKWLVVTPDDLNKKESLKRLSKEIDVSLEDMVFFGDGLNDLSMFEVFTHSYATANAVYEIKAMSEEVIGSNDEDGVGKKIIEMISDNQE